MNPKQTIKVWNVVYSNGDSYQNSIIFTERHFFSKDDAISYCFFKRQTIIKDLNEHVEHFAPFLVLNPDLSVKLIDKHIFEAFYDIDHEVIRSYQYIFNNEKRSLDVAYQYLVDCFEYEVTVGYYVKEASIEIY